MVITVLLRKVVLGSVGCAFALSACQVSKSSNPLSPNIGGPIAGVVITQPHTLEPGQDWQIRLRDQPVRLMFQTASSNGVRAVYHTIEVAADAEFSNILFRRTGVSGNGSTTTLQLPDRLPTGQTYWWRVRAEDGANVSAYSTPASFVAVASVDLGAPNAVTPTGTIQNLTPTFTVRAGSKSGPYQGVRYTLQVANDPAFSSMAALFTVDEAGGETSIGGNYSFLNGRTYYWRVQAKDSVDSDGVSPWSAVRSFTTNVPAPSPPPSGGGGGGGTIPIDPALCGPPHRTSALAILECHRAQYPEHMSASQAVAFLRGSARDMNRAGVGGGPFGILRKGSGNNCAGYSCDIICAGQGGQQRQWDVLIDEKYPTWGDPLGGPIRVDVCEIQ